MTDYRPPFPAISLPMATARPMRKREFRGTSRGRIFHAFERRLLVSPIGFGNHLIEQGPSD